MKVNKIELPKKLTESTAKQFVGRIASVCTGVECKSDAHAERVGEKNLTEAYGDTPTRAFEFVPVTLINGRYQNFREGLTKFPNKLRALVSQYNMDNNTKFMGDGKIRTDFHIFHTTAPRYVMAHLKTHTTLSHMMSSVRIGCNGEKEYEFPEIEITEHPPTSEFYTHYINEGEQDEIEIEYDFLEYEYDLINNKGRGFAKNMPSEVFTKLLEFYYKRKEITKRPLSDFEVVEMKICGYSDAWEWFINQRTEKGVQKETREIAKMIKGLINE